MNRLISISSILSTILMYNVMPVVHGKHDPPVRAPLTIALLMTLGCHQSKAASDWSRPSLDAGSSRFNQDDLDKFANKEDITQGDDIVPYELPWWHPEIEWAVMNEIGGPSFHPLLDEDPAFQRFISANTDANHQMLDPDTYDYIQSPDATWIPIGHPIIDDYFVFEDFPADDELQPVPFNHPDIHEAYLNGEQQPEGHPSVSALLKSSLPDGHPDVDNLLLDREELPSWHPDLNLVVFRNPIEPISVSSEQPDLDEDYDIVDPVEDQEIQASEAESTLGSYEDYLDGSQSQASDAESTLNPYEDDLDDTQSQASDVESTLSSGGDDLDNSQSQASNVESTLSSDELDVIQPQASSDVVSSRLNSDDLAAFAKRYDITQGDDIVRYELPWWHPEIEWAVMNEIGGPSFHPLLDDDPEFQRFISANTDANHQMLDPDTCGYIQNPISDWIPRGHPIIDSYFIYQDFPVTDNLPSVPFNHPDPHDAYLNGEHMPKGHPSVSVLLREVLPDGHPDVNDLFFEELRELPSWHPDIGTLQRTRSLATSPGSLLCYVVGTLLILIAAARAITKWRHSKRTREVIISKGVVGETIRNTGHYSDQKILTSELFPSDIASGVELTFANNTVTDSSNTSDNGSGGESEIVTTGPNQTRNMIHRNHHDDNLNPNEERVIVYKEKKSSWKQVFGKRVIKSSHSTGEAITCALYILINIAALLASPTYDLGVGFGSLSVGNTVFIFLTAARNSVLTWVVGISFEQVLVYHRFAGRFMVLLALIHACFHIDYMIEKTSDQRTVTGLISLGCGFVIVLSSLNIIRRKFFNIFFWTHYAFVGFLVGVYLHASTARPFIIASVACYGLDKGLQMLWKWPKRTTVFEKVDNRLVHCQFAKSSLSSLLGKHEVGQYVFVNFPSISLQEWHPFSVASGPSDPHIDIYIKALGDHTKKIVEYSERCVAENKQVKIRSDGPYGTLPFNYLRYGSILFVGGGIGITPILSILRDIYHNQTVSTTKKRPSHCIRNVTLVWIIPYASEALPFLDQFNSFHQMSLKDPLLPDLSLAIHVTRGSDGRAMINGQQFFYSKPQFNSVIYDCVERKPKDSTSTLVYACGPSKMVNELWDASTKKNEKDSRVDFYHETFEF